MGVGVFSDKGAINNGKVVVQEERGEDLIKHNAMEYNLHTLLS